jgi:uncharacterized protein
VRARRPLLAAAGVALAWHLILFAAAFGLPPLGPDLGPAVVNGLAGLVPLVVVLAAGWRREPWFATLRPRRAWLLLPVGLVSLTYALPGIEGTPGALAASAGLFIVLGASEELLSRGVVQRILDGLPPLPRAVWVGVIFGLGHVLSAAVFGRPAGDAAVQAISAATFGFGFAALRMHVVSIWPLAALHALDDWLQVNSPGAAPWWWQLLVAIGFVAYGRWLAATTK